MAPSKTTLPPETPRDPNFSPPSNTAGPVQVSIFQPDQAAPLGTLREGNPDAYDGSGEIMDMIPDQLPPGCHPDRYYYVWIVTDPHKVDTGKRQLLAFGNAARRVLKSNHPEIPTDVFVGEEIRHEDCTLWYMARRAARDFYERRAAEKGGAFLAAAQGIPPKIPGARKVARVAVQGDAGDNPDSVAAQGLEKLARKMQ